MQIPKELVDTLWEILLVIRVIFIILGVPKFPLLGENGINYALLAKRKSVYKSLPFIRRDKFVCVMGPTRRGFSRLVECTPHGAYEWNLIKW